MPQNLYWPRLQALWATGGHIGYGPSAAAYDLLPWADVTARLIGAWQINRGRQYELDQVTTGTWSGVLDNRDGLFDSGNTSSAVAGQVAPYQPFRIRAQWPPSVNLFTIDQATGGEGTSLATGTGGTAFGLTGAYGQPTVSVSTSAWQGTQVWQVQVPAAATPGNFLAKVGPLPIAVGAGLPYSFSAWIRSATSGANPQILAYVVWQDAAGNMISTVTGAPVTATGAATTGWTLATVSATAPAGAVSAYVGLTLEAAPSVAWTFQMDGAQFEQNSTATVFQLPGTWFNLFTGGIERYPQTWRQQGTLGLVQAVAVDALALLSQSKLQDPFTAAAFRPAGGPAPTFAYLLGDSGGVFLDVTGQRDPAQAGANILGAGTVSPGTTRTSASAGGVFTCPVGTTVVTLGGSAAAGTNQSDVGMSYIRIPPNGTGGIGPGAGGTGFTRMIAFRVTGTPTNRSAIWMATTAADANGNVRAAGLVVDPNLKVSALVQDANHLSNNLAFSGQADLGNWHLGFLMVSGDGTQAGGCFFNVTGSGSYQVGPVGSAYTIPAGTWRDDLIGAATWGAYYPDATQYNFVGDVALAIEWPGILTYAQCTAIHEAWGTAWTGDTSGARFGRILASASWAGPSILDVGNSLSLGPATDIADTDAGSALQAVTDTEGGVMLADASGNVVFQARTDRWNPAPATVVFGENTAGGEWPFEDQPVFDFDPTLVTNLAEITQAETGLLFTAQDFTSQSANGVRDRQVTSQATIAQECQDKAAYLVLRYKAPRTRVSSLTVNPSANPQMWPAVLALDLGSRAKAIRRPPAPAAPVIVDGFVENIAWSVDTTGQARLTVQISPADTTGYGVFDTSTFDNFVFGY